VLFFSIHQYLHLFVGIHSFTFFTLFVLDVVPKKILVAMNVPGLERGHVASHLQVSFYLHFIFFLYFIIILLLLIVAECELFFMARNIETL